MMPYSRKWLNRPKDLKAKTKKVKPVGKPKEEE